MKTKIFTDCDLDGAGTYLMYKWYTNFKGEVEICSQSNFNKTYKSWAAKNNPEEYDKVFVFDLDVSTDANLPLVDKKNFVIIDHHDTHIANKARYQHAKTILKDTTSCCKLMYQLLKQKYPDKKLTQEQKYLALLVDDYDSYQLKVPDSYKLNVVLWNYVGKRLEQFERDFANGFHGFNQQHKNIIHLNEKKVKRIISELQVYDGKISVGKNKINLYATFCTESLNEVAQHVINTYECDVCMIVNMNTKRVSFRKNKERVPDLDLGKLAATIAEGGGHKDSAGGKLNDNVMAVAKMLSETK